MHTINTNYSTRRQLLAAPAASTSSRSLAVPWHFALFTRLYLAASMGLTSVLLVPADGQESSTFVLSWLLLYGISAIYLLPYRFKLYRTDKVLLGFLFLLALSYLWSQLPGETLKYSVSILFNALFVFVLRQKVTLNTFLTLVLQTLLLMCSLSLVFSALGFEFTRYIDIHDRSTLLGTEPIRGLFNHKITAGLYSSMGLILALSLVTGHRRTVYALIFITCLLLTGASSAIPVVLAGLAGHSFTVRAQKSRMRAVTYVTTVMGSLVVAILIANILAPAALALLNRDPTLTGRTLLWALGVQAGSERPILGWGYYGYLGSPEANYLLNSLREFKNYEVPHFHNSYIQMYVDTGLVGLILSVWLPVACLFRYYSAAAHVHNKSLVVANSLTILMLFSAFAIHVFYKHNNFTAILIFAFFALTAQVKRGGKAS
jgi:O-antigen ligase